MKIDTGNINHNQNVDMEKTSYSNPYHKSTAGTAAMMGGIALDISGTVTDNAAYGMGELKSAQEVMQDAGQRDVALQRKYMAVMSNSMSAEDFAKLSDEGYSLADTDIEEQVTSLDKIKVKMAQSGNVIAGFNDDFTDEQIDAIAGGDIAAQQLREVFARNDLPVNEDNVRSVRDALDQAAKVSPLTDDVRKYMVANSIEPTISNLYKAEYSAGNSNGRRAGGYYRDSTDGYYARKADNIDMDQIREQVEGIITRAGLSVNDKTMAEAEWIINNGLPITERSIASLNRLNSLTLPLSGDDIVNISAIAISDGKEPVNGAVDKTEADHAMAVRIQDEVNAISDEAVNETAASGRILNIRNLYEATESFSMADRTGNAAVAQAEAVASSSVHGDSAITAMRQLEEVRLMMSTEANLKLIKQGISIDLEPLEKLVSELKEAERAYYEPLLLNAGERGENTDTVLLDTRIDLYRQTTDVFEQLRAIPAEILGRIRGTDDFTARSLSEQGNVLRAQYARAGQSYETLMTAPRADMGDSIRKAFGNVDDILKDNGFELNEANRKAVRILGYSQTEITPENISRVREAERAVERVTELMTPARTLELIRNGDNPMDENMYSLMNRLEETSQDTGNERYSRFLRKLEERNEINEQEKSAFIGVYRLLRQIEKSDGRLIGNVLSSGNELTLRNLLSASRSNRASGMDVSVDDDFGGLSGLRQRGTSISQQIDNGFAGRSSEERLTDYLSSLTKEALNKLTPEGMLDVGINIDTPLERFASRTIEGYDRNAAMTEQLNEDMQAYKEAGNTDDRVIEMLRTYEQPVTVNNLLAAGELMMNRGKTFNRLMNEGSKLSGPAEDRLERAARKAVEDFTDSESADNSYADFTKEAYRIIEEAVDRSDNRIDVDALKLLHKQISVAGSLARQRNYEVPVNIDGEWTSINLKLVSGKDEEGSVVATMDSTRYGRVAAKFLMDGKECSGLITSDRQDSVDELASLREELASLISRDGRSVGEISYARRDRLDLNEFARNDSEATRADSADLYEVAKAFISVVSRQ